jgi:hypothetical protein
MKSFFITKQLPVWAVAMLCAAAPYAQASDIASVDIFKNIAYIQTSGAAPTTPSSYFADVELTSVGPNDYSSVMVSYPGPGSPTSLPMASPNFFSYGPGFATQAAMNAAIPFGTYNYLTNTGDTAALSYTQDSFAAAIPALTSSSFNALNGLNPNTALSIGFNSFTPAANATVGYTFFSIRDSTGTVFSDGFLSGSATSLMLPGGTLAANSTYTYELDFSDRINGSDPGSGVPTFLGSDVRTDGTFTTGSAGAITTTPEPGTLMLMGSGMLAMLGAIRRKLAR